MLLFLESIEGQIRGLERLIMKSYLVPLKKVMV